MSKQEVFIRDGGVCFYCGKKLSLEEASHEHILSKTHDGPNNNYNTTIACKDCNLEAGQLPIVKKVAIREEKLFGGSPASLNTHQPTQQEQLEAIKKLLREYRGAVFYAQSQADIATRPETVTEAEKIANGAETLATQALSKEIDRLVKEAHEYWKNYYGMATADETRYDRLGEYQRKVLLKYHQDQTAALTNEQELEQ